MEGKSIVVAPSPFQHLVAGGIAGTTAALVTCPLDVIKTRLQSSEFRTLGKLRAHQVASQIVKTEGYVWGVTMYGVVVSSCPLVPSWNRVVSQ